MGRAPACGRDPGMRRGGGCVSPVRDGTGAAAGGACVPAAPAEATVRRRGPEENGAGAAVSASAHGEAAV